MQQTFTKDKGLKLWSSAQWWTKTPINLFAQLTGVKIQQDTSFFFFWGVFVENQSK